MNSFFAFKDSNPKFILWKTDGIVPKIAQNQKIAKMHLSWTEARYRSRMPCTGIDGQMAWQYGTTFLYRT